MPGGEPNRVVYMNTCWLCKSAIEAVAPSACLCVGESVGDCGLCRVRVRRVVRRARRAVCAVTVRDADG